MRPNPIKPCALAALLLVMVFIFASCVALEPVSAPAATPAAPSETDAPAPEEADFEPALMISELMADNETCFMQGLHDWVEVFNTSDEAVELGDYYISKDAYHPYQCALPSRTLEPGSFAVLVCGTDIAFNLPKGGGELYITHSSGALSDSAVWSALAPDEVFLPGGGETPATPGFANTREGLAEYRETLPKSLGISEVLSKNSGAYAVKGAYPDAVELINLSDEELQLSDFYISDDADSPREYRLEERLLAPGEVYAFALDNAPFGISASGDTLYLFDEAGNIVDALAVPALEADTSYGRNAEGDTAYFQPPTLGLPNAAGSVAPLLAPVPSVEPGVYKDAVTLTLIGEGELFYTLNGSEPTRKRGTPYAGESITLDGTCALRVRAYNGEAASVCATYNYFIGEPEYELPVMSVISAPGAVSGIYQNYLTGREVKINLSFFIDGVEQFSTDCGIGISGAGSRELTKKSFKIHFRKLYGEGTLKYSMFEGLGIGEFDELVLRCGSEDQRRAFFRDELLTSIVGASDMDTLYVQAYRPVNLYINGEYFGIYFVRERVREGYIATHLGVSKESAELIEGWDYAKLGSGKTWFELLDYCRENGELSDEQKCAYVLSLIDENSLMDYYIARAYGGDTDWANIRHIRSAEGDGKWRVVFFDLDWAFCGKDDPFGKLLGKRKNLRGHNNVIMRALLTNADFRARFLARVGNELSTTFSDDAVLLRIDQLEAELAHDMPYECSRWRKSMDGWHEQVEELRAFARGRASALAENAKTVFAMSAEEIETYFSDIK